MPGIDEGHETKAVGPRRRQHWSDIIDDQTDLELLVREVMRCGRLAELIACACDLGDLYFPPSHADPGRDPHPGVQAALRAFAAQMQAEGTAMSTEAPHLNPPITTEEGPEVV